MDGKEKRIEEERLEGEGRKGVREREKGFFLLQKENECRHEVWSEISIQPKSQQLKSLAGCGKQVCLAVKQTLSAGPWHPPRLMWTTQACGTGDKEGRRGECKTRIWVISRTQISHASSGSPSISPTQSFRKRFLVLYTWSLAQL